MTREIVAGLTVFVAAVAASSAVTSAASWPPWVPVCLLMISGILAGVTAILVHRAGDERLPADTWRRQQPAAQEFGVPETEGDGSSEPNPRQVQPRRLDHLLVDVRGRQVMVSPSDIEWIEAAGNYARLHLGSDSFLYRTSLARLVRSLGPSGFVRVHKSALVNLQAVHTIDSLSSGDAILHLRSGAEVRMSRRYTALFHERTGRPR